MIKKNKRILILGKGFIGSRLQETWGVAISNQRILHYNDTLKIIKKYRPSIIINCVGSTGANTVDDCEKSPDKTIQANSVVPIILAEACLRYEIKLIHISSGCIYHYDYKKDKPLNEKKSPSFLDLFYSRTKIYAEGALGPLLEPHNFLMVRIRIPLDNRPHPRNLLTKLLTYNKIIDIHNSVTYIPDFILALEHLIKIDAKGIYNIVNKGALRYPQLLNAYREHHPEFYFKTIQASKLGLIRTNLLLSSLKLEKSGFKVRKIKDILDECVVEYSNHKGT